MVQDRTFYFMGKDNSDKEGWIGALGKAMIKTSVMMDNMDGVYMWENRKFNVWKYLTEKLQW